MDILNLGWMESTFKLKIICLLWIIFCIMSSSGQCPIKYDCNLSPWYEWTECNCHTYTRYRTRGICCLKNEKTVPDCIYRCKISQNEAFQNVSCPFESGCHKATTIDKTTAHIVTTPTLTLPTTNSQGTSGPSPTQGTSGPSPTQGTSGSSPTQGTSAPSQSKGTSAPSQPKGTSAPLQPKGTSAPLQPKGTSAPLQPKGTGAPLQPKGTSAPLQPKGTSAPLQPKGTSAPLQPKGTIAPSQSKGTSAPSQPKGTSAHFKPQGTSVPIKSKGNNAAPKLQGKSTRSSKRLSGPFEFTLPDRLFTVLIGSGVTLAIITSCCACCFVIAARYRRDKSKRRKVAHLWNKDDEEDMISTVSK